MFINPLFACDAYKLGHAMMSPPGGKYGFSNWTARSNKYHEGCDKTVVAGFQFSLKEYFVDLWNENFFNIDKEFIIAAYRRFLPAVFNPLYIEKNLENIGLLHDLGYLPIEVWGLPEGSLVPTGIPDHVIFNTDPRFSWLPQYLEDLWSTNNWMPSTSATTAYYRRRLLEPYYDETSDNPENIKHACGDFSLRGMTSLTAGYISSVGHLMSFDRTATIAANDLIERYYGDDITKGAPGLGLPSLEHSVVCQGIAWFVNQIENNTLNDKYKAIAKRAGADWDIKLVAEMCFMVYLLTEIQPEGAISYVSDTYDYWGVLTEILPAIKDIIMARNGKLIIRPDSGDPVKIICGDKTAIDVGPRLGTQLVLWGIFHGTINSKGFMVLDSHIGWVYGDAINVERTIGIAEGLKRMGFAIDNANFGIGSFSYQYVSRDTRGYAIKATNCEYEIFGEMPLYKEPKTDPGKKSLRGCIAVDYNPDGELVAVDNLSFEEWKNYASNLMVLKLRDGKQYNLESFATIRNRLWEGAF